MRIQRVPTLCVGTHYLAAPRPVREPNEAQRHGLASLRRAWERATCNLQFLVRLGLVLALVGGLARADSSAAELRWQRGRKPVARTATKPVPSVERRHDPAVRTVAFEDEAVAGPRLTSSESEPEPPAAGEGRATLRSIVVEPGQNDDNVRSAQLPGLEDTPLPPSTEVDSRLEQELSAPFGDLPEQQPPLDTETEEGLDLDTPPLLEEEPKTTQPEGAQRQPAEREPPMFRPIPPPRGPSTTQPSSPGPSPQQEAAPVLDPLTAEPGETAESCEESLANLKAYTVDKVDLNIAVTGEEGTDFPYECSIDDGNWVGPRCWPQTTYLWKASALCHKPLYFEDEQLERYGHSCHPCCQPFVSGAHFFSRLPVLPYCMGVEPPTECIYALGHYRPGNCAPYMCNPIPLSARGGLIQAGAVVGAAAILP